jgi:hypothetical protein
MKAQLLIGLTLALASAAVCAQDRLDVQDLADRTGLTTRQVRMVLGAPGSFAEYRTSYARSEWAVRQALGGQDPRALAKRRAESRFERVAAR